MKRWEKLNAMFLMAAILSACSSGPKKEKTSDVANNSDTITVINKHYEGTGVVISIPPNKKMVVIRHDVIPGFMNAMTMPFNVADSSILNGIYPKDSVKLFLEYDGTTTVLKRLEKVK